LLTAHWPACIFVYLQVAVAAGKAAVKSFKGLFLRFKSLFHKRSSALKETKTKAEPSPLSRRRRSSSSDSSLIAACQGSSVR
jgi:hypothetical protein